jgi:DNA-binding beta-propeller fold protein YncE
MNDHPCSHPVSKEKGFLMTRIRFGALAALVLLFCEFGVAADPPESAYKVVKKIQVGGEGGWDYLTMDGDAGRLYIARADRVQVVDVEKGKLVGEVLKTPGIHGVALDLKRKKGFTSNGGEATVTIFDLETLKETGRVKVGMRPDAIIYDPASDRVFTFNAGSKDATALSAEDGTVAGTVKLDGKPESAVADEKGMVYVNLEDKDQVVAFDAKKLIVKERWPVAPGKAPVGLSMDRAKRRLFVTCGNEKMVVLDADGGKVLATVPIGKGTDASAFDPSAGLAFSSNRDGTLTIVEEKPADKFRVLANVATQEGARTMALDTKTHNLLLVTARFKAPAPGQRRGAMEPDSFVVLVVGK